MWLTAEWMDYWLDVGSGKYAKKPVQTPVLVSFTPEWVERLGATLPTAPHEQFEAFIGNRPELPMAQLDVQVSATLV